MGKTEGETGLEIKNRSSVGDLLSLRCLVNIQMEMSSKQSEVQERSLGGDRNVGFWPIEFFFFEA